MQAHPTLLQSTSNNVKLHYDALFLKPQSWISAKKIQIVEALNEKVPAALFKILMKILRFYSLLNCCYLLDLIVKCTEFFL